MTLVSVIMPVYNAEKYVEEAILSVLNQTYKNFEFIIINDGSTDNSLQILRRLQLTDKRIRLISRENYGLVTTLNEGITISKGKYLARMDADDICYSTRFEKQIKLLEKNPNLYLVGTRFELLYEDCIDDDIKNEMEIFLKYAHEEIDYKNNTQSILEGYKILHPTWMLRRELVDIIGMYRMYASEDNEFLFRAAMNGYQMGRVEEVLLKYRISNFSKTSGNSKKHLQKKSCIEFKLDYLDKRIPEKLKHMKYIIWGSDVSGEIAHEIISQKYPDSNLIGFIDSYKKGEKLGVPIYYPKDCFLTCKFDYIFICTRSGAKMAMQFLTLKNKIMEQDYFKIV